VAERLLERLGVLLLRHGQVEEQIPVGQERGVEADMFGASERRRIDERGRESRSLRHLDRLLLAAEFELGIALGNSFQPGVGRLLQIS
jgi:hypothetical protein